MELRTEEMAVIKRLWKVRVGGKYVSKAVFTVLGIRLDGKKETLGLCLSENEGANFWLSVLTDLQARGVENILIALVDTLKGFPNENSFLKLLYLGIKNASKNGLCQWEIAL